MPLIKLNKRYKGSTLIETMVAFVIITILTTIFLSFIVGLIRNQRSNQIKLKAAIYSENVINQIKVCKQYISKDYFFDDFTINVDIEKFNTVDSTFSIKLIVKDRAEKTLLFREQITKP